MTAGGPDKPDKSLEPSGACSPVTPQGPQERHPDVSSASPERDDSGQYSPKGSADDMTAGHEIAKDEYEEAGAEMVSEQSPQHTSSPKKTMPEDDPDELIVVSEGTSKSPPKGAKSVRKKSTEKQSPDKMNLKACFYAKGGQANYLETLPETISDINIALRYEERKIKKHPNSWKERKAYLRLTLPPSPFLLKSPGEQWEGVELEIPAPLGTKVTFAKRVRSFFHTLQKRHQEDRKKGRTGARVRLRAVLLHASKAIRSLWLRMPWNRRTLSQGSLEMAFKDGIGYIQLNPDKEGELSPTQKMKLKIQSEIDNVMKEVKAEQHEAIDWDSQESSQELDEQLTLQLSEQLREHLQRREAKMLEAEQQQKGGGGARETSSEEDPSSGQGTQETQLEDTGDCLTSDESEDDQEASRGKETVQVEVHHH